MNTQTNLCEPTAAPDNPAQATSPSITAAPQSLDAFPEWVQDTTPWPEPADGPALLDELQAIFQRFVILPKWAGPTLALWTLHTYAFHLRDITTYLGIESPEKRCGKTTLLSVLAALVNRPVVAATSAPPPSFASSPKRVQPF